MLDGLATDFMSETLYVRSCIGDAVYDALAALSTSVGKNTYVFFKGGLALSMMMKQVRAILSKDVRLIHANYEKFFALVDKYVKISDFDSTIMICERDKNRFDAAMRRCVAHCGTVMHDMMAALAPEISGGTNVQAMATTFFGAKHDEVRRILFDMGRPVRPDGQYNFVVQFSDQPNIVVDFEYDKRLCPPKQNKCLKVTHRDNPHGFLYASENNTIEFTDDTGRRTAFALLRVKCAFELRVFDVDGKHVDVMPMAAEVLDISIPRIDDAGRFEFMNHNHHRNIKVFTKMESRPDCVPRTIRVPCADLQYIMDDLEFAMYDFADAKTPKRQMRYVILSKLKALVFSNHVGASPLRAFANAAVDSFGALNARSFAGFTRYSKDVLRDQRKLDELPLFFQVMQAPTRTALRQFFTYLSNMPSTVTGGGRRRR
jgi:hypothetical protein